MVDKVEFFYLSSPRTLAAMTESAKYKLFREGVWQPLDRFSIVSSLYSVMFPLVNKF